MAAAFALELSGAPVGSLMPDDGQQWFPSPWSVFVSSDRCENSTEAISNLHDPPDLRIKPVHSPEHPILEQAPSFLCPIAPHGL